MQGSRLSKRGLRMLPVLIGLLVALAVPSSALASAFTIRLSAPNHAPLANNSNWWLTVYVTRGSQKLSGKVVHYQFLYQGQVVSTQPAGDKANHYGEFTKGKFVDNLNWPPDSAGQHLTLRVVVQTKYGTEYADWAVVPKK